MTRSRRGRRPGRCGRAGRPSWVAWLAARSGYTRRTGSPTSACGST
nr:MAG TPA: hypothetical protein [Bacteriophage sp.]